MKEFPVRITLPLEASMATRMDVALENGEARVELIRKAIEAELERRERAKPKKPD